MKPKKLAIILAIIGLITIFAGFMIREQDKGSCPAYAPTCLHTFVGTDIYITPVANAVMEAGAIILGGALIVGLGGHFLKPKNQSKHVED